MIEGAPKIIVIGVGNILLADEGVGVRAAERLKERYVFPDNVEVYDGGVTGMHGLMPLIEEADHLIILDAVKGPGEPGALYCYTVDDFRLNIPKKLSAHDIGVIELLAVAELSGKLPQSTIILGVKPLDMTSWSMELTPLIAGKVDDLAAMAVEELGKLGAAPSLLAR